MTYRFEIPGIPIAKKRPRFARIGKFVNTYDPQETEESRFLHHIENQWHQEPISKPVKLICSFFFPVPKGTSRKKWEAMLAGSIKHTKKPDCDNLLKFVQDCFKGVIWKDDSQVYRVEVEKFFHNTPGTTIRIEEFG